METGIEPRTLVNMPLLSTDTLWCYHKITAITSVLTVESKKSVTLKKKCPRQLNMFLIPVDITELTTSLNYFGAVWT